MFKLISMFATVYPFELFASKIKLILPYETAINERVLFRKKLIINTQSHNRMVNK